MEYLPPPEHWGLMRAATEKGLQAVAARDFDGVTAVLDGGNTVKLALSIEAARQNDQKMLLHIFNHRPYGAEPDPPPAALCAVAAIKCGHLQLATWLIKLTDCAAVVARHAITGQDAAVAAGILEIAPPGKLSVRIAHLCATIVKLSTQADPSGSA